MSELNYESLVAELIKPLVAHPENVSVQTVSDEGGAIRCMVLVHQDDLGRVIGKKGRVASAIRTLAHAAAMRNKETIDIELAAHDEVKETE